LFEKTFVEFVQPDAAVGERVVVVSGPTMVTLPPTSTVVFAPVIAALLRRQRLPRVATFVTNVSESIVRQLAALSW
jgi:hypothetical protein